MERPQCNCPALGPFLLATRKFMQRIDSAKRFDDLRVVTAQKLGSQREKFIGSLEVCQMPGLICWHIEPGMLAATSANLQTCGGSAVWIVIIVAGPEPDSPRVAQRAGAGVGLQAGRELAFELRQQRPSAAWRGQKERFSWPRMPPTGFPNRVSFTRIPTSVSPSCTRGRSRVGIPPARIWAGGGQQWPSLPRFTCAMKTGFFFRTQMASVHIRGPRRGRQRGRH